MNNLDRRTIKENIQHLAEKIELNQNLLNQLISKNIFTKRMVDDIQVFIASFYCLLFYSFVKRIAIF